MKIERIGQKSYVDPIRKVKNRTLENKNNKDNNQTDKDISQAVKYERSKKNKHVTYNKNGHIYDKETVDKLKLQSEQAHAHLKGLVEKLLLKQGHSIKTITAEEWADIEIDDKTRAEAAAMVAPDGPYGADAVSNRLVDFAKAVSGGDIEKLDKLKSAIDEGFKQAENLLGELPQISSDTYDLTMEKLDAWAEEVKQSKENV